MTLIYKLLFLRVITESKTLIMLDTLLRIGEWQNENLSKWDRILEKPNIKKVRRGKSVTNYVVGLVFDLDKMDVYPDTDLLKEYDEDKDPEYFKSIKIQGGNNKSIYATVEPKKLKQIFKTFFGKKKNSDAEWGELIEAIDKDFTQYKNSKLYQIVEELFPLRDIFLDKSIVKDKVKFKEILSSVDLGTYEDIVLVYTAVKSKKFGYDDPYPIAQLDDYEEFLESKFLENDKSQVNKGLCYASGNVVNDVAGLDLREKYSLNKMFVTTTQNYLSEFKTKLSSNNYQVSLENQKYLDLASQFLLKRYKTKIADVDHVIIPQFKLGEKPDVGLILDKLKVKSDLLFTFQAMDEMAKDIELDVENIYWINFLAFESDGNFLKTLETIKDVSKFHFQNIIEAFEKVDWEFRNFDKVVNWELAKNNYGKVGAFNLNTVYGLIPVRKDKEKKNVALQLFKSVLEQRKIEKKQLFEFFSELMLCHYYRRYNSYTNIRQYGKDYFGVAIRDSVFKFLAFTQVLKKLNLIDMENESKTGQTNDTSSDFDQKIKNFFSRMEFNNQQKAMFYLGRMLNSVTYLQTDKKKTVIDKLNFNGMERDHIVRLRGDLFEKAKQYGKPEKVKFDDSHFTQFFNFNNWDMNSKEALFFILTGYSFGIVKQEKSNSKND